MSLPISFLISFIFLKWLCLLSTIQKGYWIFIEKDSYFRINNYISNRSIRLNTYPTIIQLSKTPFIVIIGSNVWTCTILRNFRNYNSKWFFLFFLQSTTLRVIHLNDEVFKLFPTKGLKSKWSVASGKIRFRFNFCNVILPLCLEMTTRENKIKCF